MIIKKSGITRPFRICIYGEHGIGKSTFASQMPNPVFVQTEDGLEGLDVATSGVCRHLGGVQAVLQYLRTANHDYKTVVIDTVDWLERLIWQAACEQHNKHDIAEFGFGRGLKVAQVMWEQLIAQLDQLNIEKRMHVCLLAHASVVKFEDPERENYDRYQLDLYKTTAAYIAEWVDILGFAQRKVVTQKVGESFGADIIKAKDTKKRVLKLEESAAYWAKNRYGLPSEIDFTWAALAGELTRAIERRKAKQIEERVEEKVETEKENANG